MAEALSGSETAAAYDVGELVTKKDLQIELAPMRADINLVKWMLGMVIAGVAALILRSFF